MNSTQKSPTQNETNFIPFRHSLFFLYLLFIINYLVASKLHGISIIEAIITNQIVAHNSH